MVYAPFIVGIGGTTSPGSSTERALEIALDAARDAGARTLMFGGSRLIALPLYGISDTASPVVIDDLVMSIRRADGVIIASPGYHGSVSGLVKNAIDYIEYTAKDERVYLDGLPVGLIATSYGWQASTSTLAALRSIVHALRGWPTPFGAALNCSGGVFTDPTRVDAQTSEQLRLVGRQVCEFARLAAEKGSLARL